MLGRLFAVAAALAREAGLDGRGYRLVTNVGADAGQSVPHLHLHVVGGRRFRGPRDDTRSADLGRSTEPHQIPIGVARA